MSPFQRPNIAPGGPERTTSGPGDPTGPFVPGLPDGHYNPGAPLVTGPGRGPEPPQTVVEQTKAIRISLGHIQAASLVHRVEPVYPTLPLQMHREGRVELARHHCNRWFDPSAGSCVRRPALLCFGACCGSRVALPAYFPGWAGRRGGHADQCDLYAESLSASAHNPA